MKLEVVEKNRSYTLIRLEIERELLPKEGEEEYVVFVEKVAEKMLEDVGIRIDVKGSALTGITQDGKKVFNLKVEGDVDVKTFERFLQEAVKNWDRKDMPQVERKEPPKWDIMGSIKKAGPKAVDYLMADIIVQRLPDDDYTYRRKVVETLTSFGYKDIYFFTGKELIEHVRKHNIPINLKNVEEKGVYVFADRPKWLKTRLFFQGMATPLSIQKALMGYAVLLTAAAVLSPKGLDLLKKLAQIFYRKNVQEETVKEREEKTVAAATKPLSLPEIALLLKNAGMDEETAVREAKKLMETVKEIRTVEDFEKVVDNLIEQTKAVQVKTEPQPQPKPAMRI